jgi:hypothetical protein
VPHDNRVTGAAWCHNVPRACPGGVQTRTPREFPATRVFRRLSIRTEVPRSATVTVPAGTYQATVVDDTLAEKFMGVSVSIRIRTWMAKGVDPVKSQVTTNGTVVSSEELKSFTKS